MAAKRVTETYASARLRLLRELKARGWKTSKETLKEPWAEHPRGDYRISFKAQAVYKDAHSLFLDTRDLSVATLIDTAERFR